MAFSDAEKLARELGLTGVVETSAKEGSDTIDDAFFIAIVNAMTTIESERQETAGYAEQRRRGRFNSDMQEQRMSVA